MVSVDDQYRELPKSKEFWYLRVRIMQKASEWVSSGGDKVSNVRYMAQRGLRVQRCHS